MPVIRIDDDVFKELQLRARQEFSETPNYVIRRALGIDPEQEGIHRPSIFHELTKFFTTGDTAHLDEVERRFKLFGWLNSTERKKPGRKPRMETVPNPAYTNKRREAAKKAWETRRRNAAAK